MSVIIPSPYVGQVVQHALAEDGCANVRLTVLRAIAARVARRVVEQEYLGSLSGVLEGAAVRQAIRDDDLGVFRKAADQRSLHDALLVLFRELRHFEDPEPILTTLANRGAVAAAAANVFRRYVSLTARHYDVPALARVATSAVSRYGTRLRRDVGAIVLYLALPFDAAEVALLAQLGRHVPIVAGFPCFGEEGADAGQRVVAESLAAALGVDVSEANRADEEDEAELLLLSAPDPAEEVRQVARRVAADLDDGVPLWKVAVLYAQDEPYGGLIRDALDASGLPWQATIGRPLASSWAARSFLGLLELPERRFERKAVLDWLGGPPPVDDSAADPLLAVPRSAWERLSRDAQVVEGADQWTRRCRAYAAGRRTRAAQSADPEAASGVEHAERIADAIAELERATRPPADDSPWEDFVRWAAELRARYVPLGSAWPAAERAASLDVDRAIAGLADAAHFGATTAYREFRLALESALDARRIPDGRTGAGVAVGAVGTTLGASFERVYVVGMGEGALPGRPPADPLTMGDGGPDVLDRRRRAREAERRGWLAALSAADGGRAIVSYARSNGASRATYPSRWLLELAARLEKQDVYASDLERLLADGRPWLVRVASAYDGVARVAGALEAAPDGSPRDRIAPSNLADLRLAAVHAWRAAGNDLARHPLATRSDLSLGAALRAVRARRSWAFTPYDGNLAELTGTSERMARAFGEGRASATSVERWARCHFQYLLQHVLGVRTTQLPEQQWRINGADRGSLYHDILDVFFRELHAQGRCVAGLTIDAADHARVVAIARDQFVVCETLGKAGHPLAWEVEQEAILADLHALLDREAAWLAETGERPSLFEHRFGFDDDPGSWPAATVTLADGRAVTFRGVIDRVDFGPADRPPRRAVVIDYKSGRADLFAGIEDDPLLDGRHIQLALYTRAVRAALAAEHGADVAASAEIRAEYRFVSSRGGFTRLPVVASPALDRRLDRVVQRVADGVRRGVFLPVPGPEQGDRGPENCRFCDFDRVCATDRAAIWARKHHAAEEGLG